MLLQYPFYIIHIIRVFVNKMLIYSRKIALNEVHPTGLSDKLLCTSRCHSFKGADRLQQ